MHKVLGTLRDMSFIGSSRERRQKEVEEVRETGMSVQRVLRDGMAGILTNDFKGLIREWVKEEQDKVGFRGEEGEDEWMELKRWIGRKVILGGIETSEMYRMFLI